MYMGTQARSILSVIVNHQSRISIKRLHTFLGYKEVHDELGWTMQGNTWGTSLDNQGLGDLALWAIANRLPAVTGLIMDKENATPGGKFWTINQRKPDDFNWWEEQVQLSLEHDWSQYLKKAS